MKRSQIRRLASALGSHESDVVEALQRGTVDHLVEGAFDDHDRSFEERLGDAWAERLGVDPSPEGVRGRVYAESDGDLGTAWLARCEIEERV
jgi:hypothetical protein